MKRLALFAALLSLGTGALAADELVVKPRALVKTSDGRRVGHVERIVKDSAGAASAVQIIYRERFVLIPVSTLSAAGKGLVTSLSTAEVNKL
ncbi:hypothetical protein Q4610_15680 [Sphingobium sp. HBC34]|uniref:PRC-barrel domain-containing protein n=1 Tax=Sphingobium cyanobacteriorum TaxID=3063954 RepID=A0ABT8ZPN3_9SPHN|nr:hypothetical protein [Sphingobium sp. HBC34]MDO7836488.1 hypothetical protein [Sphingobium sp. HBC34]